MVNHKNNFLKSFFGKENFLSPAFFVFLLEGVIFCLVRGVISGEGHRWGEEVSFQMQVHVSQI